MERRRFGATVKMFATLMRDVREKLYDIHTPKK